MSLINNDEVNPYASKVDLMKKTNIFTGCM